MNNKGIPLGQKWSMNARKSRRPATKWILVTMAILTLILVAGILFAATNTTQIPRVTVTFSDFTTNAAERIARFTIANSSPLHVHLLAHQIGDKLTTRQADTFLAGESKTVTVPMRIAVVPPSTIQLHFRRQDTVMEEICEGLDSMLSAVYIRIPGLNPESSRNEFQMSVAVPAAP